MKQDMLIAIQLKKNNYLFVVKQKKLFFFYFLNKSFYTAISLLLYPKLNAIVA